jgi:SDR family mycofactocin-dependent oxidoreductase
VTAEFEGKVAFITGAARGQGRSHAVRFAEQGADIIALDLCDQIESVNYPMASREDLDETVNLVHKTGRRIVARVDELGRIDFVLANAGIAPISEQQQDISAYLDAVNVMLNGVYFTIEAALPPLLAHGDGGAIVITSSTGGLTARIPFSIKNHGWAGYIAAKHGVVGLMRFYANTLAEKNIRVNTVHPTGVNTPMIVNEQVGRFVEHHAEFGAAMGNLMAVPMVESSDISDAMAYLCGHSGRYITGITLPVDAGNTIK